MYQLVDFGNGRKLERFSNLLVDRPCPNANERRQDAGWPVADARFEISENHRGSWTFQKAVPDDWKLETCFGALKLFPTDFGHLGAFVEQQDNWRWIRELPLANLKLLNLFAYTGGSTLAAAKAGASVTHIDSAKNIVRRASQNAQLSSLDDRPVRWIVEDVRKFVKRERRRGNCYDGVILDPPTYGHGPNVKSTWKIEDVHDLLDDLVEVVPVCKLMLFSCHSSGFPATRLVRLTEKFNPGLKPQSNGMYLESLNGQKLACGNYVRWFRNQTPGDIES